MSQIVNTRKHTTIAFSANDKVEEELSRGGLIREIYLNLSGTLTTLAGDNTTAKVLKGDEWAVIKKIELIANGNKVLRSISGEALRMLNLFMYGTLPRLSAELGDETANPVFNSTIILPMWMFRSVRPIDTILDTRQLSDLTMAITWGDYADVATDSDGWTANPSLKVYVLQSSGVEGPFADSRIFTREETITASNTQLETRLPVGKMYRGFLINTTDGVADDGDVINNLKLKSGPNTFLDLSEEILKQVSYLRMGITRPYTVAATVGVAYANVGISANSAFNGWYFLDLLTDGLLTEAIDTLGFSEFILETDVTVGAGTTKLKIWPIQVTPVRKKAA